MIRAASSGVVYRAPSGGVHGLESLRKVRFIFFILYSFLKISINRREGQDGNGDFRGRGRGRRAVFPHMLHRRPICRADLPSRFQARAGGLIVLVE